MSPRKPFGVGAVCVLAALAASSGGCPPQPPEDPLGPAGVACGNGKAEEGEACDGADLRGGSCATLGLGPGDLACRPTCDDFDRTGCGAPEQCGDAEIQEPERCDGAALGDATCEGLGFGPGELGCSSNCLELVTTGCAAPPNCGNNEKEANEVCDGTDLAEANCASFSAPRGILFCAPDCQALDSRGCGADFYAYENPVEAGVICGDAPCDEAKACCVGASSAFCEGALGCTVFPPVRCDDASDCGSGEVCCNNGSSLDFEVFCAAAGTCAGALVCNDNADCPEGWLCCTSQELIDRGLELGWCENDACGD